MASNIVNQTPLSPRPYSLLRGTDGNLDTVPWLEKFETFLQRVRAQADWAGHQGNPHFSLVNGHEISGVTGRGHDMKAAKADLVRQLEVNRHEVLVSILSLVILRWLLTIPY